MSSGSFPFQPSFRPLITAPEDYEIYVSPEGSDHNKGFTPREKVRTFAKVAAIMSPMQRGNFTIFADAGSYEELDRTNLFLPTPIGMNAGVTTIIGSFDDRLGDLTETIGSASGLLLSDPGAIIRSGVAASVVAGAPAGQMAITGLAGYSQSDVNRWIGITGCANNKNNGNFLIRTVVDPATVHVVNQQAAPPDVNNGAILWTESYFGSTLRVTSGPSEGNRARIRNSSAGGQFILNQSVGPVGIGDTFKIETPASIIPYSSVLFLSCGDDVKIQGLVLRGTSPSTDILIEGGGTNLLMDACDIDAGGGSVDIARYAAMRGQPIGLGVSSVAGGFVYDSQLFTVGTGRGRLTQWWTFSDVSLVARRSEVNLLDVTSNRTTFVSEQSNFDVNASSAAYPGIMSGARLAGESVLIYRAQSNARQLRRVAIFNADNNGVDILDSSDCVIGDVAGSGNTNAGIHVDYAGHARIDVGGVTTITGNADDFEFGHETPQNLQNYATVRTADGTATKGYQDTHLNRVDA